MQLYTVQYGALYIHIWQHVVVSGSLHIANIIQPAVNRSLIIEP